MFRAFFVSIFLAISLTSNGYSAACSGQKQEWLTEFNGNKGFFITAVSQRFNGDAIGYINKFIKDVHEREYFFALTAKYFPEFQQAFFEEEICDYNLEKLKVYTEWLVGQKRKSPQRMTWEQRAMRFS